MTSALCQVSNRTSVLIQGHETGELADGGREGEGQRPGHRNASAAGPLGELRKSSNLSCGRSF
jgi:hypothetical protein